MMLDRIQNNYTKSKIGLDDAGRASAIILRLRVTSDQGIES